MKASFRLLPILVAAATAAAAPRVVLLDNDNLLEGEVVRVEDDYEIRRPTGDVTIPVKRVRAVVNDRAAAYALVAERANRRDADEHLRLARWCQANDLPAQAMAEAKTAVRMRPGFTAAERFVETLEQVAAEPPKVVRAAATAPAEPIVTDVPAIEYNRDSYPLFASRVNTILQNACAQCHARDTTKSFRLTRAGGRPSLTKNLMAALAQVKPNEPMTSPLLTNALTAHGGGKEAPFKTRSHPAYQTLEEWASIARAPDGTAAATPVPTATPGEPKKLPDLEFGKDAPPPARKEDPFDPAGFNKLPKK